MTAMHQTTPDQTAQHIVRAVMALNATRARQLIAVAGPPAAGKSTVAEMVHQQLNAAGLRAALVPMDGFHLDNDTLSERGLLARKGAPETFDFAGFLTLIQRLQTEEALRVPLFERDQDCTLPEARQVTAAQRHVIVEGNYLLLDQPNWRDLAPLWSYSVFVGAPMPVLRARLLQRWRDQGLSEDAALLRARSNDLPNAELVLSHRLPCDLDLSG